MQSQSNVQCQSNVHTLQDCPTKSVSLFFTESCYNKKIFFFSENGIKKLNCVREMTTMYTLLIFFPLDQYYLYLMYNISLKTNNSLNQIPIKVSWRSVKVNTSPKSVVDLMEQQQISWSSSRTHRTAVDLSELQQIYNCSKRSTTAPSDLLLLQVILYCSKRSTTASRDLLLLREIYYCSVRSTTAPRDLLLLQQIFYCSKRSYTAPSDLLLLQVICYCSK